MDVFIDLLIAWPPQNKQIKYFHSLPSTRKGVKRFLGESAKILLFASDMPQDPDHPTQHEPSVQIEDIAFRPSELVKCRCGRLNPPNRPNCLYCGTAIEVPPERQHRVKPNLRKLESWEPGWNVILIESSGRTPSDIARLTGEEAEKTGAIVEAGVPLPIARVESEAEGTSLVQQLESFGVKSFVVSDKQLDPEKPPTRLRSMEFSDHDVVLTDFNTGAKTSISRDDLALIVPGLIFSTRTDALEKKRRRAGQSKTLDETSSTMDESVLDIYRPAHAAGFRVYMAGFDFSCLGDDKGMLASENIRSLAVTLREFAPRARVINNYSQVRHALDAIWPIEARKDAKGLQRAGFGKVEFGSSASTTNAIQFTKYSRLQWHLL